MESCIRRYRPSVKITNMKSCTECKTLYHMHACGDHRCILFTFLSIFWLAKFRAPLITIPLHGVVLRSGIFSLKKWSKHCIQGHVMGKEPLPAVALQGAWHLLCSRGICVLHKPTPTPPWTRKRQKSVIFVNFVDGCSKLPPQKFCWCHLWELLTWLKPPSTLVIYLPGTCTPYTLLSMMLGNLLSSSATSVVATFSPFHLQKDQGVMYCDIFYVCITQSFNSKTYISMQGVISLTL